MGQNKRRRASTRTGGERVEVAPAALPERPTMPQMRPASAKRRGRGRPPARASQTVDVVTVSEAQEAPVRRSQGRPPGRRRGTPRGGNHERPGQRGRRRRAPVVNLDGVSSSESEGEQERKKTQKKAKKTEVESKEQFHITLSPDKMCRGIMSDTSDSEEDQNSSPAATPPHTPVVCQPLPELDNDDLPSSGSEDDIFGMDYSACNLHALQSAFKEIKSTEAPKTPPPLSHLTCKVTARPKLVTAADNDDICVVQECPADSNERESIDDYRRDTRPSSPVLFAIDSPVQSPLKKASQSKSGISRRELPFTLNESLNISSDIILSEGEEEEEVNPEIRVRIKWGNDYFREPIKKWQKFVHLYGVLGKKYSVSPERVVLSLKDKIINPGHCPGDLKVTIGDCIEGGIQSSEFQSDKTTAAKGTGVTEASKDPNSILLRVQSSDKKGSVIISLGLKEHLSILMHKYAEEKQISVDQVQFMFDGEVLNPRSTPSSLDMEGGECIDVYKIS